MSSPPCAYEALRRGLTIAQDSGSRQTESGIAALLSYLATTHGEPLDALDYLTLSIRYYYDAGSFFVIKSPLAFLALLFDRLGHHEQAAVIIGFADTPWTQSNFAEVFTIITHLRNELGDECFESFARTGEHMTTAEMVTYAFEQIDLARAELLAAQQT
jgi:hypothetical protein